MIEINRQQYKWLSEHGDRNKKDVHVDNKGMYVNMSNGFGKWTKVYIEAENEKEDLAL